MNTNFYVSDHDATNNTWGVTDLTDGVISYYSHSDLLLIMKQHKLKILGVSKTGCKIVSVVHGIVLPHAEEVQKQILDEVDAWDEEYIKRFAEAQNIVSKVRDRKGNYYPIEMQKEAVKKKMESLVNLDALSNALNTSNHIQEVDVSNPEAIKDALLNHVCVVVQQSQKKGVFSSLTSFLCTGSMAVMDKLYAPFFFDSFLLTKEFQDRSKRANTYKPRVAATSPKVGWNVFSADLRFRVDTRSKTNVDIRKQISSLTYTIVPENVKMMYILNNPSKSKSNPLVEINALAGGTANLDEYDFDLEAFKNIYGRAKQGSYTMTEQEFRSLAPLNRIANTTDVAPTVEKYNEKAGWVSHMRDTMTSFNPNK